MTAAVISAHPEFNPPGWRWWLVRKLTGSKIQAIVWHPQRGECLAHGTLVEVLLGQSGAMNTVEVPRAA